MKNSFSFPRFWQYAKAEFMSNRRLILILLGGMIGLFVVIYYLNHLANASFRIEEGDLYGQVIMGPIVGIIVAIMGLVTLLNLSMVFKKYFNKSCSSMTMMLPVSLKEKFVYSLVVSNFVVPITLIIIAFLNDIAWTSAYGIECSIGWMTNYRWQPFISMMFIGIFIQSIFFLGAVIFRRFNFLLTILSVVAINVILAITGFWLSELNIGLSAIQRWLFDWLSDVFSQYDRETISMIAMTMFCTLLSIASYILWTISWSRFRKLQITK